MKIGNLKNAVAVAALSLVLAACGGSEPAATDTTTTPVAETEPAAPETPEETPVEVATSEVEEATETVVADTEAVVEEAVTEVGEAVEETTETVAETVDAVVSGADDRVSAEVVAAYAALTGDAAKGKRVFTQCMACHTVQEGRNMAGPSLYGIVGRPAGSIEGFKYSDANANSGILWTEPTMFAYLANPQEFIPGTNMIFRGLPRPQDRADLIAYLKAEAE